MGTLWIFCGFIQCRNASDLFANGIIEGEFAELFMKIPKSREVFIIHFAGFIKSLSFLSSTVAVIFYWVVISLIVLSFIIAFDPLGNFFRLFYD